MVEALEQRTNHLNLILGDSAGGIFRRTFGRSATLLVDTDVLCCGPTPRRSDLDAWRVLRTRYWTDLVPCRVEIEAMTNDVLQNVPRLSKADRISIWAATGLSEQLFLASVCNLLATANVPLDRVEWVQFQSLPNRPRARIIRMGELNEAHLRNHPAAIPLAQSVFTSYLAAWDALTSPDPRALESFAENHASASDWLKDALRLMLRRFPDVRTGLPYWDCRLLAHVREHGPSAPRVIGETMTENWDDADLVGDWYLFGRLLKMGAENLPMPLLELSGETTNMRTTEVRLTTFGLDVLEGRASNFPANPIEDWAAGVQLSSSCGPLWFRDGDRLVEGA